MPYKEVTQSATWDFEENPEVEGEYVGKETGVGKNNSALYAIRQADGNVVKVWGSTVLDNKMANVGIDQQVKIEFLGNKPSPSRKGKTYKDFAVFVNE
jgi:hypothetical protein